MSTTPSIQTPFFIVGCVRSGTTLLRDILRNHPRLECPEETHFFRWADPFGAQRYENFYRNSDLLKKHREMDGIDNHGFHVAMKMAMTRKKMADWYGEQFLKLRGNPEGRWFDKTPQNVYGILLISGFYPEAQFIHIHRNPLNVAASLGEGRVMPVHSVIGAINYWLESMIIIGEFKKRAPERLHEIPYESLTENPAPAIHALLEFLGEDPDALDYGKIETHPERNKYRELLSAEDVRLIRTWTEPYFSKYGYASD
jgi:hypothetical protein